MARARASERLKYILPSLTRSCRRTELVKLAASTDVGTQTFHGERLMSPEGRLKSRCDGRREKGSVGVGTGAAGRVELCFSCGGLAFGCWAKPEGVPATSVSRTEAVARNVPRRGRAALTRR